MPVGGVALAVALVQALFVIRCGAEPSEDNTHSADRTKVVGGADLTVSLTSTTGSSSRCNSAEVPLFSKCQGCPPMYNGKPCASTTWYEDHTEGSCGCGKSNIVEDDYWTLTSWTAALNTMNLSPLHPASSWCPPGCGQCYELCTTGGSTNTDDKAAPPGECKVFKITNRCADGWVEDRPDWCSQTLSWEECKAEPEKCQRQRSTNLFGYSAHFDLQDAHRQIQHILKWDNPEVTFEQVSCDSWEGPKDAACIGCQR